MQMPTLIAVMCVAQKAEWYINLHWHWQGDRISNNSKWLRTRRSCQDSD